MEKIVKDIMKYAKMKGVTGLVLISKQGSVVATSLEQISYKDALIGLTSAFNSVLTMDLEAHPNYSPRRGELYSAFMGEFKAMIQKYGELLQNDVIK